MWQVKRAWRYIFNGLTLLSLLACVATIILWVRSYWVAEGVSHNADGGSTWMLTNERGYLGLTTIRYERESPLQRPVRSQPWVFHRAPADPAASQDYAGSGLTGMLGLGSSGFARPIGEGPPHDCHVRSPLLVPSLDSGCGIGTVTSHPPLDVAPCPQNPRRSRRRVIRVYRRSSAVPLLPVFTAACPGLD